MYNHERPNLAIGGVTSATKYKEAMSRKNSCSNLPLKTGGLQLFEAVGSFQLGATREQSHISDHTAEESSSDT